MSSTKLFVAILGTAGLAVPLSILAVKLVSDTGFSPAWVYYVWPSYFVLGGLAGEVDTVVVAYVLASILLNVVLYAYIGILLARAVDALGRLRGSTEHK